ncbi:Long-chain-fatty-acid--CoA ligase [Oopsacas minuta]|uniref:long-chain-fatty-acid--CoA ligase n=1 Tax=Oopsacas minuta TaxID=111878 RepID=A0AAV7JZA4_9METZ|nr:Long-chain-fatty-acid--CoA ligase [Oopsacas minuta]
MAETIKNWVTELDGELAVQVGKEGLSALPPRTIPDIFRDGCAKFESSIVYDTKRDGKWVPTTFNKMYEQCMCVAKSLLAVGLKRFEGVSIMGFNSPEWIMAELGTIMAGGLATGIYTTNNVETTKYILENSGSRVAIGEHSLILEKLLEAGKGIEGMKFVQYSPVPVEQSQRERGVISWEEFLQLGKDVKTEDVEAIISTQKPGQCSVLVYTSGTTGMPKGVMLSHDNLYFIATSLCKSYNIKQGLTSISYLPLSHIAAILFDIIIPLLEVQPNLFLGVTGAWEIIYSLILPAVYSGEVHLEDVRNTLGLNKAELMFIGASHPSQALLEFFKGANMQLLELYGCTETAGPCTVSLPGCNRNGAAGKIMDGAELKIYQPNSNGEGEICIRGRHIFMGYLRNPDKTAEVIDNDSWFHTGDLGYTDSEGFIWIVSRIKEILIHATGMNVIPMPIEEDMKKELKLCAFCVVVGEAKQHFNMLVTLKSKLSPAGIPTDDLDDEAVGICKSLGVEVNKISEAKESVAVKKYIQDGINRANERAMNHLCLIKKFTILPLNFSINTNELTPTESSKTPDRGKKNERGKSYSHDGKNVLYMARKKKLSNQGSQESILSLQSSSYRNFKKGFGNTTKDMESIVSSWVTPLHTAAAEGRCDQLNLLLEYEEVDINIQTKLYNDYEGIIVLNNTPLHLAIENGHAAATTLLLKNGANSEIQNAMGCTALHVAAINGVSAEIVQDLIQDSFLLALRDKNGRTPLFCAAEEGWHNLIPLLLDQNGCIELTDNTGETPLIVATKNGFSQTMKILLASGAHMFTRDKRGLNAMDYALRVNERSIQDEQVFDQVLSTMLNNESKETALAHLHNILYKYNKIRLKECIISLLNRIPELRARKVIICSKYLECSCDGLTPDNSEFSSRFLTPLQMIADTYDENFAFHPLVRVIVDKKMRSLGYYYLLFEMAYLLFFLFSIFFIFTTAASMPDPLTYTTNIDYVRAVFEAIVVLLWLCTLIMEIAELVTDFIRIYHKELAIVKEKQKEMESLIGMVARSLLSVYFLDVFNYFDILGIVVLFLVLPFRLAGSPVQWIFATLTILIHFMRFIKVVRLLPGFGTYVHTIGLIALNDVPKFCIVSFTIIIVISQSFFIALRVPYAHGMLTNISASEIGEQGLYDTFYWTLLFMTRVLLQGENILDDNYLFNNLNWMNAIIYLFAMGLIIVILLNIFIAQVSDTYATAKSKSERIVALYRLKFIVRRNRNTLMVIRRRIYEPELVIKGNNWKAYQKTTGGNLDELTSLLERQTANLEQFKLQIRQLKISIQDQRVRHSERPYFCMSSPVSFEEYDKAREMDQIQSETSV